MTPESPLASLLAPKTVAVFGISSDPQKLGNVILANVVRNGFRGRIYGVGRSPSAAVEGAQVVGSFEEIPGTVDVALFAVPAERLIATLEATPRGKVKVVVAIASGFSEVGSEGERLEKELRAHCAAAGQMLIGPNCQGVVVPSAGLQMTFSPMYDSMVPGSVAIISQSGAMGGYMANRLMQRGVGLSLFVSSGNETVVGAADYVRALNAEPSTRVVLYYMEKIADGRALAEVMRGFDPAKRLVIVKTGRSDAGARAIASHTGAIAGDDAVVDGVCEQFGIIRARDSATAVDCAAAIASGRRLRGPRIAVLSVAGGLAVELTDILETRGFRVPEFDAATRGALEQLVPSFGATRNPVDLTGAVLTQEDLFEKALEVVGSAPGYDAYAVISTYIRDPRYAHAIVRLFRSTDKPVVVCWTGSREQTPQSLEILAEAGVPVFDNTGRAATAFCALRGDPHIG